MNATELFHKDGKSAKIFYCAKCRKVRASEEEATACCAPYKCEVCGKESERYHLLCADCRRAKDEQKERERFENAEKVTEWDGPVNWGDAYAESLSELLDEVTYGEDVPEYVWTCDVEPVLSLDPSWIIENATQDAYEDFDPTVLAGEDEFKAACDKFCEANKDVVKCIPNYKRALLVPKEVEP